MDFIPEASICAATTIRIRLTISDAKVSNLPWPNSWSLSFPLDETRTKAITTMSLSRSDRECTPSAIMAALLPNTPAAIFPADRMILTTSPANVTFIIFFSLKLASITVTLSISENPRAGQVHSPGCLKKEKCTLPYFLSLTKPATEAKECSPECSRIK